MHLAALDQMSNNGESCLHHMKPLSKMLMTLFFIAGVVVTDSMIKLVILLLFVGMLHILSRNNLRQILHLAIYPLFFSSVFALIMVKQSPAAGVMVVLRSLGAATSLLLLIATTPYVDIFSVFSLFMPALLVDIFVFTYRSLFILLDKLDSLFRNIRLKGGFHPLRIMFNLRNMAGMLGILIIHSFDMSERMYRIYALRGYTGSIPLTRDASPVKAADIVLIGFSIIIFAGMVIPWHL